MAKNNSRVVGTWVKRVQASAKEKQEWETRFEVKRNKAYYLGDQLAQRLDENNDRRVQINLVGSAVRAEIPALSYYYPHASIVGRPEREDTPGQKLDQRAQLLQDTANSIVQDPTTLFREQTHLSLKEAFWAIGCVETGYEAEFEDSKRSMDANRTLKETESDEVKKETLPKLKNEVFFVRRIPARQILVSKRKSALIQECDWVGYWEYQNLEDVKAAPAYSKKVTSKLTAKPGEGEGGRDDGELEDRDQAETGRQQIKIYKIWDLRTRKKLVFVEGCDDFLMTEAFKRLPLHFLRFEMDPDEFFPIPPIYHMLHPQDEYNDSRDMLRKLRKGIVPRYTYDENLVDPEDMEKLESGEIGTYIPVKGHQVEPIRPINQPSWSESMIRSLAASKQEFDEMSGVGAEQRQVAESKTAKQAQIVAHAGAVQNSFNRQIVADWLGDIINELLQLAIDHMVLDRWILRNVDPFSQFAMREAQNISERHQEITFQDLQDANSNFRWDVTVSVDSLSPVSRQEQQAAWNQALTMLANPSIAQILALSPELAKKTLDLNGVTSAREQELIGEALAKMAQQQQQMAMAQGSPMQGAPNMGTSAQGAGAASGSGPAPGEGGA